MFSLGLLDQVNYFDSIKYYLLGIKFNNEKKKLNLAQMLNMI